MDYFILMLKIIIFLPMIIILIFLSAKLGGSKLHQLGNTKYMKILDRLSLSKDNAILAVKIGDKGYIIASSLGKIEILKELSEEEIIKIEESHKIKEYDSLKDLYKRLKVKGRLEDENK